MKARTIKLAYGERVVAVVPERCNGPGWSNAPTWVYIATNDGRLREECVQPGERTPELQALFAAGEAMCNALAAAVPVKKTKMPNVEFRGALEAPAKTNDA
jgi:hypothetical protein